MVAGSPSMRRVRLGSARQSRVYCVPRTKGPTSGFGRNCADHATTPRSWSRNGMRLWTATARFICYRYPINRCLNTLRETRSARPSRRQLSRNGAGLVFFCASLRISENLLAKQEGERKRSDHLEHAKTHPGTPRHVRTCLGRSRLQT